MCGNLFRWVTMLKLTGNIYGICNNIPASASVIASMHNHLSGCVTHDIWNKKLTQLIRERAN